jgi:O-succinylbenzoic acid--CoA ligase
MATPLEILRQRTGERWLIGLDAQKLLALAEQRYAQLQQAPQPDPPSVLLSESDPLHFLAGFVAASTAASPLFLGNPRWATAEWQSVLPQIQPNLIWGPSYPTAAAAPAIPPGWIMIPTGGSSGQIRFAIHTLQTLTASVIGLQQHFQVNTVHSVCVLPLYHVSGLMQFWRSLLTGGQFILTSDKTLTVSPPPEFSFLSLVPTQLQRLLQQQRSRDWLQQFSTVLLGGAPAWPQLLTMARQHQICLAPTYGMTETASQIATLKPTDFLSGQAGCGPILPHAEIRICSETGALLPPGAIGSVQVEATSLTLGYWPYPWSDRTPFCTDDLGYLDDRGWLHIVGRRSQKIITGGENVFPAEVEAAIWATGLVLDVCVVGLPDPEWGERVTAVYVPRHPNSSISQLQAVLGRHLSRFKQPKQWVAVPQLPRNSQGKINHSQLLALLSLDAPISLNPNF